MRYKAGIIGCGKIGGFLDSPGDNKIITHAHAYSVIEKLKLVACCDKKPEAVARFRSRWGKDVKGYSDPDDFFKNETPDVVSICTDTSDHAELILKALKKKGLKVIICEKPLVSTLNEFKIIRDAIAAHPEKRLVINYSRRYDPSFRTAASIIKEEKLGKPVNFQAIFTKGIYHNGCHVLELVERLFGEINRIEVGDIRRLGDDYYGRFFINSERCSGTVSNFTGDRYAVFEMDIYMEEGKIRISQSGHKIEIFGRKASLLYPGYYELRLSRTLNDTMTSSSLNMMKYVYAMLSSGRILSGLSNDHLKFSKKMLKLKDHLSSGTRSINLGAGS